MSGTLVFQQGETQKTVQIFTINDTIGEPDEYFQLGLHSPSLGAVIMDSAGTVYIYDDDAGGGGGGVPTD
ncbi:MAG: hypothetical protein HC788_05855 [Sphingopyxis sp.]|nr:hypothetical protein [Sphingopyxis sp.]